MKPAGTLRWIHLGFQLEDATAAEVLVAEVLAPSVESQVPDEPHPSLVEWIRNQDEGFLLTFDAVHPQNPPDWWDIEEDAVAYEATILSYGDLQPGPRPPAQLIPLDYCDLANDGTLCPVSGWCEICPRWCEEDACS